MSRTIKRLECMTIETAEGNITFTIDQRVEDGIPSIINYSKQDHRAHIMAGECYFSYKNEKGYRRAINRLKLNQ